MKRARMPAILLLGVSLTLSACEEGSDAENAEMDIVVQCHSDTSNLRFGDEQIGTLLAGESRTVHVESSGTTLVTWTNSDNEAQSDEIQGTDVEDDRVWHLYYSYGSWIEW